MGQGTGSFVFDGLRRVQSSRACLHPTQEMGQTRRVAQRMVSVLVPVERGQAPTGTGPVPESATAETGDAAPIRPVFVPR